MNPFEYKFEWDPKKAKRNAEKHGVSFERAATVFLDPNAISIFDEEHGNEDEQRWITLGRDRTGTLIVLCHTFHEDLPSSAIIRIISARRASKKERKSYLTQEQ